MNKIILLIQPYLNNYSIVYYKLDNIYFLLLSLFYLQHNVSCSYKLNNTILKYICTILWCKIEDTVKKEIGFKIIMTIIFYKFI